MSALTAQRDALASVGEAAMHVLKGALFEHSDIPPSATRRTHTYLGDDKKKPS